MSFADNVCDARFITTLHSGKEIKKTHQITIQHITYVLRYYIVEGSMTYNLYACKALPTASYTTIKSMHTHTQLAHTFYRFSVLPKEQKMI